MSDSVWPHRQQPTRPRCPWDSPGKNTGVGCHFLLQCMKVESESEVAQSCLTLSDPMDCSLPGSFIHGIFQARVVEWGAIAFSQSSRRSQQLHVSLRVPLGPGDNSCFAPKEPSPRALRQRSGRAPTAVLVSAAPPGAFLCQLAESETPWAFRSLLTAPISGPLTP